MKIRWCGLVGIVLPVCAQRGSVSTQGKLELLLPLPPVIGKTKPIDSMHVYHAAVLQLFRICDAQRSVVVYGEYFGGWHPQASHHGPGNTTPVQRQREATGDNGKSGKGRQRQAMGNRATGDNGRQREVTLGLGITIGTGSGGNGRQREAMGNRATGGNGR